MATLIYGFTSLNVADGNSLKEINGALLNDADMALGIYNSQKCFYQLDANSGATESLPDIVSPSLNAGTKRWILKAYLVADITANGLTASKAVFTDANKKLISIGTLGVDQGGTGASTLTDHGVLLGSGTDPITALGAMTNGQLVIGSTGNDPVVATITEGEAIDIANAAGAITIACEDATTSNKGVTVYSGTTKALAGTDTASAMTPADVAAAMTKYNVDYATAAEITTGTEAAKAIAPDQLKLSSPTFANITDSGLTASQMVCTDADKKLVSKAFATAAEITAGTESAKAIAPDQLALTKYNGDWSFWGIKNLRLVDVYSGDHTKVKVNPSAYNIPILIGEHWHVMTASVDVDSVDDLDTGTLAAGTDYYVYACTDGTTLSFKVSANSTNPTGFDAAHSRKIGGFHTLCAAVGTISGHPLTDYAVKDILPASIWDLKHRAKNLVNVGLVYDSKIQKWVDIYLASGTGANTTSVNGGTISDTRNWMDFVDDGLAVGKRLLTDTEFTSIATGSNEETNITDGADPGTTGGHVDTAGRRMISNIGCEDCCGVVWQWLQDQSYYYYGATGYWGNLPGGKGSSLGQFKADPGAPEMDNSDSGGDVKLVAGGYWVSAARAGSRSRAASDYRWRAASNIGARFVSEPL